ncbi:MAG: MerR family transcriptional regulator [Halopseudomonas sp.]|uniref:MerR family transcriptional regulator n=1 Tax=Halopseudomonas sp. TaxID=2901191 RepID=UPI0030031F95
MTSSEKKKLPIRDVARVTGVNPVTLRAWERRYGLVKPHRTAKGHRLYGDEQLQQIQQILTWLERGVAISQVAELLRKEPTPTGAQSSVWQQQRERFLFSLARYDSRQLASQYHELTALYPTPLICAQLFEPILVDLEQRPQGQYGQQLEKQFLLSWLQIQLAARLAQEQERNQGATLLLSNLSATPEPRLTLLALLLSGAGYRLVVLHGSLPISELLLLHERRPLAALLLVGGQRLDTSLLERDLPRLSSQADFPLYASGPITEIHAAALQAAHFSLLGSSPSQSLEQLQNMTPALSATPGEPS